MRRYYAPEARNPWHFQLLSEASGPSSNSPSGAARKVKTPLPLEGERQEPAPDLIRGEGAGLQEVPPSPQSSPIEGDDIVRSDGGVPGGDSGQTVVVQDGDTLDKLAKRIYGRSDEKIWEMIQKSNSGIRNVDFIRPGQQLVFPPLPEERSAVSGQRSVRSLD